MEDDKTSHLGIRANPPMLNGLRAAAAADDRSVSSLVRRIVADWLVANGWLKAQEKRDD
jgi:hypothetical protein